MKLKNIIRQQNSIIKTVNWIEQKAERVYSTYEKLEDCYTQECDDQRGDLREEMQFYLNKLKLEEKNIDSAEEKLYALSGRDE